METLGGRSAEVTHPLPLGNALLALPIQPGHGVSTFAGACW
jgi:hypothetical protein